MLKCETVPASVAENWGSLCDYTEQLKYPAAVCPQNALLINQSAAPSHVIDRRRSAAAPRLCWTVSLTVIISRAGSAQQGDRANMAAGRGVWQNSWMKWASRGVLPRKPEAAVTTCYDDVEEVDSPMPTGLSRSVTLTLWKSNDKSLVFL